MPMPQRGKTILGIPEWTAFAMVVAFILGVAVTLILARG